MSTFAFRMDLREKRGKKAVKMKDDSSGNATSSGPEECDERGFFIYFYFHLVYHTPATLTYGLVISRLELGSVLGWGLAAWAALAHVKYE